MREAQTGNRRKAGIVQPQGNSGVHVMPQSCPNRGKGSRLPYPQTTHSLLLVGQVTLVAQEDVAITPKGECTEMKTVKGFLGRALTLQQVVPQIPDVEIEPNLRSMFSLMSIKSILTSGYRNEQISLQKQLDPIFTQYHQVPSLSSTFSGFTPS